MLAHTFHAIEAVHTDELSYEEWLFQRRAGIGGSDVAAICGLSKWKSPYHVYLEKVGQAPATELGEAAEWGTRLEPLIANKFAEEHPEWAITEKKVIYCHPNNQWATGNLDRMIICPFRGRGILEIKTASEYLKQEWDQDNIPDYYYVQLQWYLYVTGLKWGYFATLIGGNKYREYEVYRDDEMIGELERLTGDFWFNHVEQASPPPIDGSEATSSLLSRLYPSGKHDEPISLTGEELIAPYLHLKQVTKELQDEINQIENQFKSQLQEHTIGTIGEYLIKWSNRTRTGIDTKQLKEQFPDIYKQCLKQTYYRQFSLK